MTVLTVDHITKTYGNKKVVNDVSFSIESGEIAALVGPNGAGKTTLLRMITNLISATSGNISIMNHPVQFRKESLAHVAAIIEHPALYETMSGSQNLDLYCTLKKIPKEEIKKVLTTFGLDDVGKKKVKKYSLGMKQRLGIASCFLQNPKLMILDEPTNGLDPQGIFCLRDQLLDQKQKQTAILISSHQLDEVQRVADRVLFLKDGKLVANLKRDDFQEIEQIYKEVYG